MMNQYHSLLRSNQNEENSIDVQIFLKEGPIMQNDDCPSHSHENIRRSFNLRDCQLMDHSDFHLPFALSESNSPCRAPVPMMGRGPVHAVAEQISERESPNKS